MDIDLSKYKDLPIDQKAVLDHYNETLHSYCLAIRQFPIIETQVQHDTDQKA